MDKGFLLLFIITVCVTLSIRCTHPNVAGGSDNPDFVVVGKLQDLNGKPAGNTIVSILSTTYNPVSDPQTPAYMTDTTDAQGKYNLWVSQTGVYNIMGVDKQSGTRVLVNDITVLSDTSKVDSATLAPAGAIKIFNVKTISKGKGYIYIPGTSYFTYVNENTDSVEIDDVPKCNLKVLTYVKDSTAEFIDIRQNITVISGKTAIIYNPAWKYNTRMVLNTTSLGAAVLTDIKDFPVLIRLNSSNFNFSQAQPSGTDIYFSKPDNTPLSYEIERWDPVAKIAEVWVKMDTVYGNADTQSIVMYWGNGNAAAHSNSTSVFDTSGKFIGVWHLNETPVPGESSMKDRTYNAHHAESFGTMAAANSVDGVVGNGLTFDGKDDYLNVGILEIPSQYSMGLWVRLDTAGSSQRFIFKDSCYSLWFDKENSSVRMEHMSTTTWWRGLLQDGGTAVSFVKGEWIFFMATFDGSTFRLYKNGVEVSRTTTSVTVVPQTSNKPLQFGRGWGIDYVKGIMDEIRIEGTVRSADWVKLCYMNQRSDDKLIIFK
jgi:hypothetical protein